MGRPDEADDRLPRGVVEGSEAMMIDRRAVPGADPARAVDVFALQSQ